MSIARAARALSCLLILSSPQMSLAREPGVDALFELSHPDSGPFPSNRFSQIDLRNLTNLQLDLPKPDCAERVTDCQDVDVINTLDGFNLQPRLRIPFSGPIDPATVDSSSVFHVLPQ
jgi:hypothetical protein